MKSRETKSPYPILSPHGRKGQIGEWWNNSPKSPLIGGTWRSSIFSPPYWGGTFCEAKGGGAFGKGRYKKAFTLVELIIVITILAILATIAFMSFQGYAKQSRDSNRLTTIKTIEKWVDLFLTKSGKIPAPDEATAFTGGSADNPVKISQWTVWAQMVQVINMNQVPLDPKTQAKYHYSVFWETPYYQIGIEQEQDSVSYISPTFADLQDVMISGNYTFDPSLPSLFVIEDSVVSWGLFGTWVCFVVDGGLNTFKTENEDCETKTQLLEKGFDTSLVGYWDMESTTWGKLKDLSGNGNHGTFSGTEITPNFTWWLAWKSLCFNQTWTGYIVIPNKENLNFSWAFSLSLYFNTSSLSGWNLFSKRDTTTDWYRFVLQPWNGVGFETGFMYNSSVPIGKYFRVLNTSSKSFDLNSWYSLVALKDSNWEYRIYINWKKVWVQKGEMYPIINNSDLILGAFVRPSSYPNIFYNNVFFVWKMDEVKLYNKVLSDQEIAQQARIAGF